MRVTLGASQRSLRFVADCYAAQRTKKNAFSDFFYNIFGASARGMYVASFRGSGTSPWTAPSVWGGGGGTGTEGSTAGIFKAIFDSLRVPDLSSTCTQNALSC